MDNIEIELLFIIITQVIKFPQQLVNKRQNVEGKVQIIRRSSSKSLRTQEKDDTKC